MIDPKQGPLPHARCNAAFPAPARDHLAERASVEAAPETAGIRPRPSKRQFSFVGG
jgi:hypothetical protein